MGTPTHGVQRETRQHRNTETQRKRETETRQREDTHQREDTGQREEETRNGERETGSEKQDKRRRRIKRHAPLMSSSSSSRTATPTSSTGAHWMRAAVSRSSRAREVAQEAGLRLAVGQALLGQRAAVAEVAGGHGLVHQHGQHARRHLAVDGAAEQRRVEPGQQHELAERPLGPAQGQHLLVEQRHAAARRAAAHLSQHLVRQLVVGHGPPQLVGAPHQQLRVRLEQHRRSQPAVVAAVGAAAAAVGGGGGDGGGRGGGAVGESGMIMLPAGVGALSSLCPWSLCVSLGLGVLGSLSQLLLGVCVCVSRSLSCYLVLVRVRVYLWCSTPVSACLSACCVCRLASQLPTRCLCAAPLSWLLGVVVSACHLERV